MKIVFSTPDWNISGVNSFNHNLMRGLLALGHDVELLLIPGDRGAASVKLPQDVPTKVLDFDATEGHFTGRWNSFIRYLNAAAPCIYVPGYDFYHSCVAPCLDDAVGIVGVVHSDDPWHYEHLIRLGRYWNGVVGVSQFLFQRMIALEPEVMRRSVTIHYGVPCPATLPARDAGPLRIAYAGRFVEEQKRVSDLPKIALALAERGVEAHWTLIGDGPEDASLRRAFSRLKPPGTARFTGRLAADAVLELYQASDVLILTSSYEGLPLSLLEAMAHGAIPVVSAVESGIPEVVQDGVNGFAVPIGDIAMFADRLATLAADPDLRQRMHRAAFAAITQGPFSIDAATRAYAALFERVMRDIQQGIYKRPRPYRPGSLTGDILPPPALQLAPDLYFKLRGRIGAIERALGPLKTPVRALVRAYYRHMTASGRRSRTVTKP